MKKIFKNIVIASTALLMLGGCKKLETFHGENVDPNRPVLPVTSALLTNAEYQIPSFGGNFVNMSVRPGLYVQYFSETQYTDVSLYNLPQFNFGLLYYGPMEDLQVIIDQNTSDATKQAMLVSGDNNNQIAVATILKTYYIWMITDGWGDVPYSQALEGNPNPKYDKQEDIYRKMLADLRASVALINPSASATLQGDLIYDGDMTKWKKLANSMRMLISLRMSKVFPAPGDFAATEFAAAVADPGGSMETNADNAVVTFNSSFHNPWYDVYNGRTDYAESKTYFDILNSLLDTRKSYTGTNTTAADMFPYGLRRDLAVNFTSAHPGFALALPAASRTISSSWTVLSASFSLFARAEAALRGWTSEPATARYDSAIVRSFERFGAALPAAYLTEPGVALTGTTATDINLVALQRYIDLYPDGAQAWAEWRRTGVPSLTPTAYATNSSGQIPRRYVYGLSEYSTNPANLKEAASRLSGGDTQDARVWWDK